MRQARILKRFMQAALVDDRGLSDEDLDSEIQAVEQMRGRDGQIALRATASEVGVRWQEKRWKEEAFEARGAPDEGVGQVEVVALARSLLACRQLLWAEAVAL